ncbi:MAG: O-antigen ligase family protein [Granulosicoccus sp.]
MRVATYTQPSAASRRSMFALLILVGTILMGTGVVPRLTVFAGGPLSQLMTPVWLLLYSGALLGLMFTQGINWVTWLIRYRILLVFVMVGAVMSISWSIDTHLSVERTIHLVGSTLLAVYIGFSVPLLSTLRIFAVTLALTLLASVAVALGIPALGIESYEGTQVWKGVYNSKNDLGFWAAIGVLLYLTLSDSTHSGFLKALCYLMAAISLAALALSESATSLLALLVAGTLSLYLFIAIRFQLGFVRMCVLAVLFVALVGLAIANIETAELVGRSSDLTGRGEVWQQTWQLIMDRPLTGYGYGALWFPNESTLWIQESLTDFTWVVHHAHNGLLQVASEIGMPLALLAILMVAQQLIEIFYCQYERQQVGVLFVLAFAIAFLISNYSEARFLVTRELYWIFFLALPISMLRQINVVDSATTRPADTFATNGSAGGSAVPGKPWLTPPSVQDAGAVLSAPQVAYATAAGNGYRQASITGSRAEQPSRDVSADTDIDLGDIVGDADVSTVYFDDSLDVTGGSEQENREPETEELSADYLEQFDIKVSSTEFDNTFGDDRYDIDLDITGEWIDLPLEEEPVEAPVKMRSKATS